MEHILFRFLKKVLFTLKKFDLLFIFNFLVLF